MAEVVDVDFPVWGLLPKKETNVVSFLNKNPTYDGRGIIIAIFDSGVDPGAPGLQKTSEGKTKVIERFDCSGAGDVDTTTIVRAKDGEIKGLTGRKLKLPSAWKNPTGDYHIGVKNASDLYPAKLRERIEKERKETLWDFGHKIALANATKNLQTFETSHNSGNLSPADKLIKEDLEAQIESLQLLEKRYNDPLPAYDCVVFHDGTLWRACVDTSEKGELSACTLLGEYSKTHEFASLTPLDQLTYSINVHNQGNTLEIVSMCSSHGTHVASIASAYFPENPEQNGVAPGAQIVSLTIGDNRLGSMETGTALIRAMIKVMTMNPKVHVINMSYGEHAHYSCSGRLGELMNDVIDKHGIVWVASAGNHGPALCTIGTPPDISTNNIIGVGAYVSPDMMVSEYSLRKRLPACAYTWTSRGPTIDGDQGVTVAAPGGAITSVPNFTLRGTQLMNGTSMASPHVCGAVANLLSGMEQNKFSYSPYSVKRALENTAQFMEHMDPFAQGAGLLQVERAWDHLAEYNAQPERDIRFHISCGALGTKGIHLRSGVQDKPRDISITVEPRFLYPQKTDAAQRISFNLKLALACREPWVEYPSHLDLMNLARVFTIRIDPTGLPKGVHSTTLRAYDISNLLKGPVFSVTITVVCPEDLTNDIGRPNLIAKSITFKPNTIQRHFVLVPEDATWAVFNARCLETDKSGRFILHTMQLRPKMVCKTLETHRMFTLSWQADHTQAFPVRGGLILELVVAKYWASIGDMQIDYNVTFHGVKPDQPYVTMQASDGVHTIEVRSSLATEEIQPQVQLKQSVQVLRPTEFKLNSLSERDVIPPSRQIYELLLTYQLHMTKGCEVTLNCTTLSDLLYESEFESQLWMLFDSHKHLVASGDAYPSKYSTKLEKGEYTVHLQVRHERRDLLEKMQDLCLQVAHKISQPITLDLYSSMGQALIQGKKMSSALVPPRHLLPVYIAPLPSDKISKMNNCQFLSGTITYAKDDYGKKVDVYPFKYILIENNKKSSGGANKTGDKEKDKTKHEEYLDSLRDLKVNWLAKHEAGSEAKALYDELCAAYPDHLQVHVSMLSCLGPSDGSVSASAAASTSGGSGSPAPPSSPAKGKLSLTLPPSASYEPTEEMLAHAENVIEVADKIISAVDQTQLLAFIGTKNDNRPDAAKIKSTMDKQKSALVEALTYKGCALCLIYRANKNNVLAGDASSSSKTLDSIEQVWNSLISLVDQNDHKATQLGLWYSQVLGHDGRVVRTLLRQDEERGSGAASRETMEKLIESASALGWSHVAAHVQNSLPVRYPHSYRPF